MSKYSGDTKRVNLRNRKQAKMRLKIRELKLAHLGQLKPPVKPEEPVSSVK